MLIYAVIGAFGLLFLLVMLFVGEVFGGDHDLGGVDAGGGHLEFGHEGGPSIFSTRVMAAFLAAFGGGGIIGRYLGWSHPASSGLGVVTGIVMAGAVYEFAHLLYSQQASSEVQMTELVGHVGEVIVGIPAHGVGQVSLVVHGERTAHIARSRDGSSLPLGTTVVITGLSGEGVTVERGAAKAVAGGDRS